ncbi:ketopantoate reductase [Mucilaginibacter sp. OK268]|jgi:2-dehydropantoate 2-reductase|uniref:ketopantoate reductase family protein n=1 Tax=Mucilaginibacter sp. OK268 TaxID=1881048 RepID=UPI00087ECE95|nr:ketopantoate reductase family protein [Mucilaginibacter sp. OK268]SDP82310.1 ketopantoate reductase [Mucilaginibacter sp. OK268]
MKNHINSVYIVGLGAMGSMYAAKLQDINPGLVKIIASAERIKNYQSSGIKVNEKLYEFNYIQPGDHTCPPADLIIVAVKSPQLASAINDLSGFVHDDTIVISLLNGISSEEQIGEKIGMKHLLFAYGVGMDAVREGNMVTYSNPGRIVFGEKEDSTDSQRVQAVKELFDKAAIPNHIPTDMYKALWFKFMMNAGINQASAVLKAPYGQFQQNKQAHKLMLMAAEEVVTLSHQVGIFLGQDDINEFTRIVDGLGPEGKTSMLQDIEAGRKSEVELFAGTVIELGRKYQVPTPVNETLYTIIRALETSREIN